MIFDSNNIAVGFFDYYNFDAKKGARSTDGEIKTGMVREASRFSNAMPFRMSYGIVPVIICNIYNGFVSFTIYRE